MGAWGTGSFENDDALDWAARIKALEDIEKSFAALKDAIEAGDEEPYYIEATQAAELVAAADTIAMLMGRPSRDVPDDLKQRLADAGEPDINLVARAQNALSLIFRDSELAELWAEADGEINQWNLAMTDLIARLNPENAPPPLSVEEIQAAAKNDSPPICVFCNEPIAAEELLEVAVIDHRHLGTSTHYMWAHLRCLNARVHHSRAIQDFQYDPDNLPDIDDF
ncbi:MAG: DUF4259 domain-containing protein [Pseudomonadota bacterium]